MSNILYRTVHKSSLWTYHARSTVDYRGCLSDYRLAFWVQEVSFASNYEEIPTRLVGSLLGQSELFLRETSKIIFGQTFN